MSTTCGTNVCTSRYSTEDTMIPWNLCRKTRTWCVRKEASREASAARAAVEAPEPTEAEGEGAAEAEEEKDPRGVRGVELPLAAPFPPSAPPLLFPYNPSGARSCSGPMCSSTSSRVSAPRTCVCKPYNTIMRSRCNSDVDKGWWNASALVGTTVDAPLVPAEEAALDAGVGDGGRDGPEEEGGKTNVSPIAIVVVAAAGLPGRDGTADLVPRASSTCSIRWVAAAGVVGRDNDPRPAGRGGTGGPRGPPPTELFLEREGANPPPPPLPPKLELCEWCSGCCC